MCRRPILKVALLAALLGGCVDLTTPAGPGSPDGRADDVANVAPADARPAPDGPDAPAPAKAHAAPCASDRECQSGFCVDGVCCQTRCAEPCHACNGAGGAGTCAPATAGTDPHNDCAAEAAPTCGRDGTCDGRGACRPHAAGSRCAEPTCADATESAARTCDGAGTCRPALTKPCAPYRCGGTTCAMTCAADMDCGGGSRCEAGRCTGLRAVGQACTAAAECGSGFCVDGVCCNGACAGACSACNLSGSVGLCAPVPAGADPAEECAAEPAASCGRDGSCDGRGACRLHPAGTVCAPGACAADVQSAARACTGAGVCAPAATRPCGTNEVCGGALCATNRAPSVNAGADQTSYSIAGGARLAGTVTDDGLPAPAAVTVTWSQVSGPAMVAFQDARAVATTVTTPAAGTYVLRLTASDGKAQASDELTLTVLALDQGLVGHWRFDEGSGTTAADASGGRNTATLLGGARWGAGRLGGALDVPGSEDHASVPDPADGRLDFGTGDFTVAVWMRTSQKPALDTYPEIVRKMPISNDVGYEIFNWTNPDDGDRVHTVFKVWSAGEEIGPSKVDLADGRWHHLAGRKRGDRIELLVDGVLASSVSHQLGSTSNTGALNIGGLGAGQGWADYDGLVDDVRIYARALGDADVAALAAAQP